MQRKNNFNVLALDPSLTEYGWAVLNNKGKVLKIGCVKTKTCDKKLRIRKGDDRVRRVSEINQVLFSLVKAYEPWMIVSELPHGSQSAVAALGLGLATGLTQGLADFIQLPIEWYSEGDCKNQLLGKASATKNETQSAIDDIYEVKWTGTKYIDHAVADAISVFNCAKHNGTILKLKL